MNLLLLLISTLLQAPAAGFDGTWNGTLDTGAGRLRLVFNITRAADGLYLGSLQSLDQGGIRIPIDAIKVTGDQIQIEVKTISGTFSGALSADKNQVKGTWTQVVPRPLDLSRVAAPAATAASTAPRPAPPRSPFGLPLNVDIPVAPAPFSADGKTHIVYELHITNFSSVELLLSRLEVIGESATLAAFEGGELNGLLVRPGAGVEIVDKRALGPGTRAIAYLWITLDAGATIPASLQHKFTVGDQTLEAASVRVSTVKPIVLGAPLRGSDWFAANGPSNTSNHRRALMIFGGKARVMQRFAIDWLQLAANGQPFSGDDKDNKSYPGFGEEILAVADGVVTSTKDGIPENVPGPTSRAVPITPETIGGNFVVLDLGEGRYAFYAHLQPGSLRVKTGDRVRRGQVLGLVGNTGNSTAPHLHFQIGDASSPIDSEGLPYVFDSFEVMKPGSTTWEPRKNELPLQNVRVRFSQK